MAVVNSEKEADNLRSLYLNYGPYEIQEEAEDYSTTTIEAETTTETTPVPAPDNAIVHIGFHDQFIEGEYLTVLSK
jgi:hypothetical protein